MLYRVTVSGCWRFGTGSSGFGGGLCAAVASDGPGLGNVSFRSSTGGFHRHGSYIRTQAFALTPSIQDKSRMREICSYGSARGVAGNRYPYRDPSQLSTTARRHTPEWSP